MALRYLTKQHNWKSAPFAYFNNSGKAFGDVYFGSISCIFKRQLSQDIQKNLDEYKSKIISRGLPKKQPIEGVKDIVLVSSGKGGVGKSTTAVNLAVALKINDASKNVGLLDSDVFGPTVPTMMNLDDSPKVDSNNFMEPLINYGVKCMSMGFLIGEGAPIIWRGLMVMQALQKLMRQVAWGNLDYLIIDTPPGTGDTHLSLVQNLPISGAILVTTPQLTSLQVTKRGANMFKKLAVPVIGIVENMSSITCPSCSTNVRLFGDATEALAREVEAEILQQIPLQPSISTSSDSGVPIVISEPDSPISKSYKKLAESVTDFLSDKDKIKSTI